MSEPHLTVGIAVLTRGDRQEELATLADSLAASDADERLVLVNGGTAESAIPAGWRVASAPDNLGIPGGRTRLFDLMTADVVIFVDDDAVSRTISLAETVRARFAAEAQLAALSLRIVLPSGGSSQQQHNPRLGRRGDGVSGLVTSFLGGAVALRRAAVEQVGGYCDDFFMYHEETDLAWRLIDAGWRIEYAADLVLEHPPSPPSSRADGIRLGARNRVWLARRRLPRPLVPLYLGAWTAITLLRLRSVAQLRAFLAGSRQGLGPIPGTRSPMSWRTVWKMTRLGRPPII